MQAISCGLTHEGLRTRHGCRGLEIPIMFTGAPPPLTCMLMDNPFADGTNVVVHRSWRSPSLTRPIGAHPQYSNFALGLRGG